MASTKGPESPAKRPHRDRKFTVGATIDGLDDVEYYTSETILDERDLPESISIIGGGYIALEGADPPPRWRRHHDPSALRPHPLGDGGAARPRDTTSLP